MGTRIQQGINNALSQTTFLMGATGVGDKLQQDVVDKNTEAAVNRQEEKMWRQAGEADNKAGIAVKHWENAQNTVERLKGLSDEQLDKEISKANDGMVGDPIDPAQARTDYVNRAGQDATLAKEDAKGEVKNYQTLLESEEPAHAYLREQRTELAKRKLDKALRKPTTRFGRSTGAEKEIDQAMTDYNRSAYGQSHNWMEDRKKSLQSYDKRLGEQANETAKSQQEAKSSQKAESREYMASMKKKVMYAAMGLNSNGQTEEDTNE